MRRLFARLTAVVLLLALSAACASTTPEPVDPALDNTNSALLYLYRSQDQYSYLDQPAFYLDGQPIGTVERGGVIVRRIIPGLHRLSLRRPFFDEAAAFSTLMAAGRIYYIRFGVSDAGTMGAAISPVGYFSLSDEAGYNARSEASRR